ncbi:MAG: cysteine-rich CWC family protein [Acidovorax sp.]|uniref:cysteine-rich CWC family protein n=1 Tax=Acidovorax sp. TaxID=1872122 RepID=UPI003918AC3D
MPAQTPPPSLLSCCPLCGQPNQCAMVAGRPPESCWCMAQVIDSAVLATLPEAQRGKACICANCGTPQTDDDPPSSPRAAPPPI